jgi:hypothetical protein
MKSDEFKRELVLIAGNTLENIRVKAWERGKSDLLEISEAVNLALRELCPGKGITVMFNTQVHINPDVGPDFPEEVVLFLSGGGAEKPVFVDRFYLRRDGCYPVVGYYPKDNVIPIGDKEGLQQRILLHFAAMHSPVVRLLRGAALSGESALKLGV